MIEDNSVNVPPMEISLIVRIIENKPCIELRRHTTDFNLMKVLVRAAYHNQSIIVRPIFRDTLRSLNSLVEKGILNYNNENKQYEFLI